MGLEFRNFGLKVWSLGFGDLEYWGWSLGFKIWSLEFEVKGFGFGFKGSKV
jgi:hypothetical protein